MDVQTLDSDMTKEQAREKFLEYKEAFIRDRDKTDRMLAMAFRAVERGNRVIDLQDDRFTMQAVVVSHALKQVAAEGQQRLVSYDYRNNKKAPLPEPMRRLIEEFKRGD